MTTTDNTAPTVEHGATVFIPLNKLKKHPKNARKTPHSEASIEAKAASIAAKGILQNLVVEPETNAAGEPTSFYLVSIGEGRRQAQMLRAKRKEIKKTEPIRCVIDTANDAAEISLDENVTREDLHPADQFERFRELSEDRGWGAEEIAARFGVTAHVVKQRMRLGAVSPKLLQVYRDGDLTLDQLMAFAITDDHARQEHVYENLSYNRDPSIIRLDLTKMNVPATDRCAVFVGARAYTEAGGTIIRDLFTEDHRRDRDHEGNAAFAGRAAGFGRGQSCRPLRRGGKPGSAGSDHHAAPSRGRRAKRLEHVQRHSGKPHPGRLAGSPPDIGWPYPPHADPRHQRH